MPRIHLIKNDPGLPAIAPIAPQSDIFRSGYWAVAEDTANALIGGQIFFHEKQAAPSFFGGTITNVQRQDDGEYAGRMIFFFQRDAACVGTRTERDGWTYEKKIVM